MPQRGLTLNGFAAELVRVCGSGKYNIVLVPAANQIHKSWTTIGCVIPSFIWGGLRPDWKGKLYDEWPYPKKFRICSTASNVREYGVIDEIIKKLWPRGRYTAKKLGSHFPCLYETDNGFVIQVMSYEQGITDFESDTMGCVDFMEPPDRDIYRANQRGLSQGGIVIMEMTPLTRAGWVEAELIDGAPAIDKIRFAFDEKQQKVVRTEELQAGATRVSVSADIEVDCIEHGINGHVHHFIIEQRIADMDDDEVMARARGMFMHRSGLVYSMYDTKLHMILDGEFWQKVGVEKEDLIFCVIDHHTRRPPAIVWIVLKATDFRAYAVMEYPAWTGQVKPYHKMTIDHMGLEQHKEICEKMEQDTFGRLADVRFIDGRLFNAPGKGGYMTIGDEYLGMGWKVFQASCQESYNEQSAKKALFWNKKKPFDEVKNSPRFRHLASLKNLQYGFRNWVYLDPMRRKGLQDVSEKRGKDFKCHVQCVEMFFGTRPEAWMENREHKPSSRWTKDKYGFYVRYNRGEV